MRHPGIWFVSSLVLGCGATGVTATGGNPQAAPASPTSADPAPAATASETSQGVSSQTAAADPTAAQTSSGEPYISLLGGRTFEEGKGFPGIIAIGDDTPSMYKKLGGGREDPSFPFWYFYDKGPWTLTLVAEFADDHFRIRGLIVAGTGAPATSKGVHVNDSAITVTRVYGKAAPFTGSVGSPLYRDMVAVDVHTGARRRLPDSDAAFRDSLFYPDLGTIFVMKGGKVAKIVAVAG